MLPRWMDMLKKKFEKTHTVNKSMYALHEHKNKSEIKQFVG